MTDTRGIDALALFGAMPLFARPLEIGQRYFPQPERYREAVRGIINRQYYTNQGPLASELERRLQDFLGVRHAICVTNGDIALVMALTALAPAGPVLVPALCSHGVLGALHWAGLQPRFGDVDPVTGMIGPAEPGEDVGAILAVNLWSGACDLPALRALADRRRIPLLLESGQGFGMRIGEHRPGHYGDAEVFDFSAVNIINASEGGCICTDDDLIAARLRNIRSSYGAGPPVEVVKTSNGRMSEAQAALALLALDDVEHNRACNRGLHQAYAAACADIPGLRLLSAAGVDESNFQCLVCAIDQTAFGLGVGQIVHALRAENVLASRPFDVSPVPAGCPAAARLHPSLVQLPLGAGMTPDDAHAIGVLLRTIQQVAPRLRAMPGA